MKFGITLWIGEKDMERKIIFAHDMKGKLDINDWLWEYLSVYLQIANIDLLKKD